MGDGEFWEDQAYIRSAFKEIEGRVKKDNIKKNLRLSLKNQTDYSITLQRCIEYHASGRIIPDDLLNKAPHHAKMLNNLKKGE